MHFVIPVGCANEHSDSPADICHRPETRSLLLWTSAAIPAAFVAWRLNAGRDNTWHGRPRTRYLGRSSRLRGPFAVQKSR